MLNVPELKLFLFATIRLSW